MHAAYALVVDASSNSMCTNEWNPTASTLCPLGLPCKKTHEVSQSYTQKQAQNDHFHRISYVWVAVSKATFHLAFRH